MEKFLGDRSVLPAVLRAGVAEELSERVIIDRTGEWTGQFGLAEFQI